MICMFVIFHRLASKPSATGYAKTALLKLNNICKRNPVSQSMKTSLGSQIFCTTVLSHDIPKLRTMENQSLKFHMNIIICIGGGYQFHATSLKINEWQKFKSSRRWYTLMWRTGFLYSEKLNFVASYHHTSSQCWWNSSASIKQSMMYVQYLLS
jgi:hypothetical protein